MLAYRHRLIFVTFTLAMLLYIDRIAISTAKGSITGAFALSDTQFGWVLSAFALGCAESDSRRRHCRPLWPAPSAGRNCGGVVLLHWPYRPGFRLCFAAGDPHLVRHG